MSSSLTVDERSLVYQYVHKELNNIVGSRIQGLALYQAIDEVHVFYTLRVASNLIFLLRVNIMNKYREKRI